MDMAQYIAAASFLTSAAELVLLSQSSEPVIRARVAENPIVSLHTLVQLARDEDCAVRMSVALNPRVTMNILEHLACDECPDVRYTLAEDHQLSEELLEVLAVDENPYVAQRATLTLHRLRTPSLQANVRFIPDAGNCDRKAG